VWHQLTCQTDVVINIGRGYCAVRRLKKAKSKPNQIKFNRWRLLDERFLTRQVMANAGVCDSWKDTRRKARGRTMRPSSRVQTASTVRRADQGSAVPAPEVQLGPDRPFAVARLLNRFTRTNQRLDRARRDRGDAVQTRSIRLIRVLDSMSDRHLNVRHRTERRTVNRLAVHQLHVGPLSGRVALRSTRTAQFEAGQTFESDDRLIEGAAEHGSSVGQIVRGRTSNRFAAGNANR
jgi:hypothetical protein